MGKLIPIPIFPLPSILKGSKNLINVVFWRDWVHSRYISLVKKIDKTQ